MMPIYMQYSGISGDAQSVASHEQWIEISSFQWGVGRGISSPTGGSSDREGSSPSVSEIVVTKPTDVASPSLLQHCLQGTELQIPIIFKNSGSSNPRYTLTLNHAVITDITPDHTHPRGGKGHEKLTLTFSDYHFNGLRNIPVPHNIGSF
jgi:type VI secretion system secreted protein Hcp